MAVKDGALAEGRYAALGEHFGASGKPTVSGSLSSFTTIDELYIGKNGAGEVLVENGGLLSTVSGSLENGRRHPRS